MNFISSGVAKFPFHSFPRHLYDLVGRFYPRWLEEKSAGWFRFARHLAWLALEAYIVTLGISLVVSTVFLGAFWLYYASSVPATQFSLPIEFDYSSISLSSAPTSAIPDSLAIASGVNSRTKADSTVCAEIVLPNLPKHIASLDVKLHATIPQESVLQAGMQRLQLLDTKRAEITKSRSVWRPLLLLRQHWLLSTVSAVLWGSFVMVGLARDDHDEALAPLAEKLEVSMDAIESIASARLCTSPPLHAVGPELRLSLRSEWPWSLLRDRPVLLSLAMVFSLQCVVWGIAMTVLLIRVCQSCIYHPTPGSKAEEAKSSASKSGQERCADGESASVGSVSANALKRAAQSLPDSDHNLVEAVSSPADDTAKVVAASAGSAAFALGTGGGCAGLLAGGIAGAACGVIPAVFTFGLSIPVGFFVGAGSGAMAGSALGGSVGAIGGGTVGYTVYTNREALADSSSRAREVASEYGSAIFESTNRAREVVCEYCGAIAESTNHARVLAREYGGNLLLRLRGRHVAG